MKVLLLLFLAGVSLAAKAQIYSLEQADIHFERFINTYGKQYADESEKVKRFEIFKQNLQDINQKNLNNKNGVYGITMFSDLTPEEFIQTYTGFRKDTLREGPQCTGGSANSTSAPDSWDWKQKGKVSRAKNQERCGSCWAFSTIGTVEAQYAIKHKKMVDLSEQQLVDCDKRSNGCKGSGSLEYAFLYLKESTGSMLEKDYTYQNKQGSCKFNASKVAVNVADCITYTPKTEEELKNIVYSVGPVTIAVDATGLQLYTGKVLEYCPLIQLNHAVMIAGYGIENGTPYWLIKNSWGEDYGENGFVKIKRGVNACGLMTSIVVRAVLK